MNNITTAGKLGIIITDLADNFDTFCISQAQKTKHLPNWLKTTRMFSDTNIFQFKEYLEHLDFTNVLVQMKHMLNSLNCINTKLFSLFPHVKLIIKYQKWGNGLQQVFKFRQISI